MNVKVIMNKDLSTLGEEGDVKEVARGFARNYLFPRSIAVPYTSGNIKMFESRKTKIEQRKQEKRQDAASVKERLEALELSITMPAGANGKLYGAVTSQSVMDELAKQGFQIERKRIEIPGNSIKSVGKYKFTIKLYGNAGAELFITIKAQEVKTETKAAPVKERRRRRDENSGESTRSPEGGVQPSEAAGAVQEAGGTTEAVETPVTE